MTDIEDILAELQVPITALQKIQTPHLEGSYTVTSTTEAAPNLWTSLLEKFPQTQLYPVILRDPQCLEEFANQDITLASSITPPDVLSPDSREAFLEIADRFGKQASNPQVFLDLLGINNTRGSDGFNKPDEESRQTDSIFPDMGGVTDALNTAIKNTPPEKLLKTWQQVNHTYQSAFTSLAQMDVLRRADDSECKTFHDYVHKAESLNVPEWFAANYHPSIQKGEFRNKTKLYSPKPSKSDTLMLVPVSKSFYVPAFLRLGCDNIGAPPPSVHVAVLKRWSELYGTEIYMIAEDELFLSIAKPITDKQVAMQVAIEQSAYCPEVCLSGDGTLAFGALQLLDSNFWQFFWHK